MRKALILGLAGVFFSSAALACGWHNTTASSGAQQTVMTDQNGGATGGGQSVKTDDGKS